MTLIPTPEKILVVNLAFIGDVLLMTPMVRALRENYPAAVIDMLVVPLTKPIACANPYISEVLTYDKKGRHKKAGNLWQLVKTIRERRYDMAVCANFAPRGAMIAFAAGISRRVGYDAQHARWFLTHAAPANRQTVRHEAENYLDVLKPLGITTDDTGLDFKVNASDIENMRKKTGLNSDKNSRRLITVICPVGRHKKKNWTVRGCAGLIKKIAPEADCYLIGGENQLSELNNINEASGNLAKVLAGTLSLGEVSALIAAASLMVSVDTGPLHIAEAVKTPVVALFGSADPRIWGPRGAKSKIFTLSLDCSPCWGDCENNRCIQEIDETAVISAAENILRQSTAASGLYYTL